MYSYYTHSRKFLKENFDIVLKIPIMRNNRLTRALGRYIHYTKIELSGELLDHYDKDTILDVLNHELVHYALHTLGQPFRDNDKMFIDTCNYLNVGLTRTIEPKILYVYKCDCMERKYHRRKKFGNYICAHCKGDINFNRKEVI